MNSELSYIHINNNNDFIIKSEGLGGQELGFLYYKTIFKHAFPDKNIIFDFDNKYNNPDLVLRGTHFYREPEFNYDCPYISVSGEPYRVNLKNNVLPLCEFNTYIPIIKNIDDPYSTELIIDPGMFSNKCPSYWKEQLFFITKNEKSFYVPFILYTDLDFNNINKYSNINDKIYDFIYIGSNFTQKIRNDLFSKLFELYDKKNDKIKSLGPNLNTEGYILDKKVPLPDIYKHFKFVFAIENNNINGYVTEKILLPFIAGSVPIYWGNKDVKKYFNVNAFFYVNDYLEKGWYIDDIVLELKNLAQDDNENTGWKKYLKEPILKNNKVHDIFNLFNKLYISDYCNDIINYIKNNYKYLKD